MRPRLSTVLFRPRQGEPTLVHQLGSQFSDVGPVLVVEIRVRVDSSPRFSFRKSRISCRKASCSSVNLKSMYFAFFDEMRARRRFVLLRETLNIPMGCDGGCGAVPSRRDKLGSRMLSDVSGSEQPGHRSLHPYVGGNVSPDVQFDHIG